EIGEKLIDIHSQHETLLINNAKFVTEILDNQAGNTAILKNYKAAFENYSKQKQLLTNLQTKEKESSQQRDYLKFQLSEFEGFDLQFFIDGNVEENYQLLANAGEIKTKLSAVNQLISGENSRESALSLLKDALQNLN